MRKFVLTSAAAAVIGLVSMAGASAQMATGTNEGMTGSSMSNATAAPAAGASQTDGRMNASNAMKKKKMKKSGMQDGMSATKNGSGAVQGGQAPGATPGGGMQKKM